MPSSKEKTQHINVENPLDVIYLKGDEITDGSLKLKPDVSGELFQLQIRQSGVWNNTGLKALGVSTDVDDEIITVTATDGLTVTNTLMRVVSDGGDVNVTANPQISPGRLDGQSLHVHGTSDNDKVIFTNGNGLSMSTSVTLGLNDIIVFMWNTAQSLWIMMNSDTK